MNKEVFEELRKFNAAIDKQNRIIKAMKLLEYMENESLTEEEMKSMGRWGYEDAN